jgi:hypothetical protein
MPVEYRIKLLILMGDYPWMWLDSRGSIDHACGPVATP